LKRRREQLKTSDTVSNSTLEYIKDAVAVLENGGVISFPTETYYGLGVDPFNIQAVDRLFQIKKRDRSKPILVLVSDVEMLTLLVSEIPPLYRKLMDKFWPGPLTLIFPAKKRVSDLLTGETKTIGIRVSSNPIVKEIFKIWHKPITATSANISNKVPAKSLDEVVSYFDNQIDFIIDGGEAPAGLCSSIIALESGALVELRKGQIPFSELIE
jgi:L-threonylcarbamoyladenylate synthase